MVGKDIVNTLKDILLLKEKVSALSEVIKEIMKKLDNYNERIIKLETKLEVYEDLSKRRYIE